MNKKINTTMGNSHSEISLLQQAYEKGLTQGQNLTITVRGASVCPYCLKHIAIMADAVGLQSLTIINTYEKSALHNGEAPSQSQIIWIRNKNGVMEKPKIFPLKKG